MDIEGVLGDNQRQIFLVCSEFCAYHFLCAMLYSKMFADFVTSLCPEKVAATYLCDSNV